MQCTSNGTIAIQNTQAYGTWEFGFKKTGAGINRFFFVNGNNNTNPNALGYYIFLGADENIGLAEATGASVTTLFLTYIGYFSENVSYRIKVTRTLAGEFTVYIKGGSFGDSYTQVDVSGGSGTNPVTDTTHTASSFFTCDMDTGDTIRDIIIKRI